MQRVSQFGNMITARARRPARGWKLASLIAMTSVLAMPAAPDALAEIKLTFGTYAADKPTETVRKFRPLLDALEDSLSARLGEPVHIKMQVANSYEKGVENLVTGAVDFARFGPASYVTAKQIEPQLSILAMESKKGKKVFHGVICVAEDSPVNNVSQLTGKTFAFGNERSTIGRYLSQLHLMENGVTAAALKSYRYLGRHDAVGTAVGRGQFDAGALKESTFKKLVSKGVKLRAIATFPNVTKPWIARASLPPKLTVALRSELLAMKDKTALKALKKDGFVAGTDSDYAIIRAAIQRNRKFF